CHCLGACCGAAPVAIAQPSVEWVPTSVSVYVGVNALADFTRAPNGLPPHTLPFPTAPPASPLA
ncbi:MAG TPA: hypothetical protein VIG47_17255, partial [Gemmatimonadaceae bacterium]